MIAAMEQQTKPIELGFCYASALETIVGTIDPRIVLVHGYPTLTRPPFIKYGHAWLEVGPYHVFDSERKVFVLKDRYYVVGKIDPAECFRYTRQAAYDWANRTRHYGPWEGPNAGL